MVSSLSMAGEDEQGGGMLLPGERLVERGAVEQRSAECDLVGVFDFVADRYSPGQLGDLDRQIAEAAVYIKIGGFSLHGGAERQYDPR